MPFEFTELEIPDLVLVEPRVFADARGHFLEAFKSSRFAAAGLPVQFLQANLSRSRAGVVRGLHYQLRSHAQGKLITVIRGAVHDVAVDIREGSPWYGRNVGVDLDAENHRLLWIPPGFAHGFCSLEDDTEVLYLVTAEYAPDAERGIHWLDEDLGIEWPLPPDQIRVSERDSELPPLRRADNDFVYAGGSDR